MLLWHIMVLNCRVSLVWPYVASYGLDIAFHGHDFVRPHYNYHGLVCPSKALYGLVWFCMALYGLYMS